jgi:hypothetical protein
MWTTMPTRSGLGRQERQRGTVPDAVALRVEGDAPDLELVDRAVGERNQLAIPLDRAVGDGVS